MERAVFEIGNGLSMVRTSSLLPYQRAVVLYVLT